VEKEYLFVLPKYEYEVFRYEALTVSKDGFISVDTVKYGLSPEFYDRVALAKIYFDKIEAYYDHALLKTFKRSYEENGEVCDWREYLPALVKKPGATEYTRFFNQMPKLWQQHLKSADSRERKSALTVLMEIVRDGNDVLCDDALALAAQNGRTDADSIRQCYYIIAKPESYPQPLRLSTEPPVLNYRPDLKAYDNLAGFPQNPLLVLREEENARSVKPANGFYERAASAGTFDEGGEAV
jgi:hypothetical protein